jgi:diadenosine tetraphosphate (Ap4A) HIT family hydrolase
VKASRGDSNREGAESMTEHFVLVPDSVVPRASDLPRDLLRAVGAIRQSIKQASNQASNQAINQAISQSSNQASNQSL